MISAYCKLIKSFVCILIENFGESDLHRKKYVLQHSQTVARWRALAGFRYYTLILLHLNREYHDIFLTLSL